MTRLRCTRVDQHLAGVFTVGKIYQVWGESPSTYALLGDDGYEWLISRETLGFSDGPHLVTLEPVENSEDSSTTPEEDEEFERIQKKVAEVSSSDIRELADKVLRGNQEPVDCPVAIAYYIHEIQKWLKHVGCSSEAEFRISSDYVWASPDEFVTYEAKEGGVGTLIEYMRHIGGANKCVEKMEDVG